MRFLDWRRGRSAGRHEHVNGEHTVELLNARDLRMHLLTEATLEQGRKPGVAGYVALCGQTIIPVPVTLATPSKWCTGRCDHCREHTISFQIPQQRGPQAPVVVPEPRCEPAIRSTNDRRGFGFSRIDGRVHRLNPIESGRLALAGFGKACCGALVHSRELGAPDAAGLCRPCWGVRPS